VRPPTAGRRRTRLRRPLPLLPELRTARLESLAGRWSGVRRLLGLAGCWISGPSSDGRQHPEAFGQALMSQGTASALCPTAICSELSLC
jgi:hypothetical protein